MNELINVVFQDYERYNPNVVLNEENADIINTKDTLITEELLLKNSALLMQKQQINFLLLSTSTIIISLIGLIVFILTGLYFIHPAFYILLFLMGLGWEATAVYLIKSKSNEGC